MATGTADEARPADCVFCALPAERVVAAFGSAVAFRDLYPVSPGHTLVIPRRHVVDWWGMSPQGKADVLALVDRVKADLDAEFGPDGFNVGFNAGTAAGQTVFHAHVHVIPRFTGDVPDPRGGVRWVLPDSSGYLTGPEAGQQGRAGGNQQGVETAGGPGLAGGRNRSDGGAGADSGGAVVGGPNDPPASVARLHDGPRRPLAPALADAVDDERVTGADVVVSFVMVSGLHILQPLLDRVLDRGGRVRVLTSDYLGVTEKAALGLLLERCREYGDRFQVRVFQAQGESFHPKSYLLGGDHFGYRVAFTGSANVSRPGLAEGHEWTVENRDPGVLAELSGSFERLWSAPESVPLTSVLVDAYAEAPRPQGVDEAAVVAPPQQPFAPTPVQVEALAALESSRAEGFGAGLVVMATGLGKTWLAAFDSARPAFRRVLFVAHREEILAQARDVFRRIRPEATVGYLMGQRDDSDADIVLATVQTLHRRLSGLAADRFDDIVIDEFHHAAAASYRRVVNHFTPRFLLGLTATPDRADGADLLALCEDNLVFACGLPQGVERGLLSPFHYFGVPDPVDFAPLPWRNSRFDPEALETAVISAERTDAALREWRAHRGSRTLGFCVSIRHADWMAAAFTAAGIRAVAVHTGPTSAPRHQSLAMLESGELEVVFSVDVFNEGVDVPAVDTVLLLRPTASPVLFLQQIGRGLRLHPGKTRLSVVDFVGNHRSFLLPARILLGLGEARPTTQALRKALADGDFDLPAGCSVDYSTQARDNLLSLLPKSRGRALASFVEEWLSEHGVRPTAVQAYRAGVNPAAAPGGWFGFLGDRGLLPPDHARTADRHAEILTDIASTSMTKSYKMVALRAFAEPEALPQGIPVSALAEQSRRLILRDPRLVADVTGKEMADIGRVSPGRWEAFWRKWPLEHLTGKGGFRLTDTEFHLSRACDEDDADTLAAMINELVDWRLARYLDGKGLSTGGAITGSTVDAALVKVVRNSGDRPIIMLRREANPDLPEGRGVPVRIDTGWVTFDFVKVAVNVARDHDGGPNLLPDLLLRWFGPQAGLSGTEHRIRLWQADDGWHAEPLQADGAEKAQ